MAASVWMADIVSDAFRGKDVQVIVHPGWKTRSAKTTTVDHQGVMGHDTGSRTGSKYSSVLNWVITGSSIAPLCNLMTGPPGYGGLTTFRIDVIAAGRTNHAGQPDDTWDPFDAWLAALGNKYKIGVEHFWTQEVKWSSEYIDIQAHLDGALLSYMEKPASRWIAHREYASDRKVDPRLIKDLDGYRRRIEAAMTQEDIVATLEDLKIAIQEAVPPIVRAIVREEVWDNVLDRKFKNWYDGVIEPIRATLHHTRRDSGNAVVASIQALEIVTEIAKNGGMSEVDIAHVKAIVEDTIRNVTLTIPEE